MPDLPPNLISDPKALRALSHPLRWRLINLLIDEGTATATRCAKVTDESVASCSYHLKMLAKYGFVTEADGGQGREKPWKVARHENSFTDVGMSTEGALAAEAAADALLDNEFTELRRRTRQRSALSPQWRRGQGVSTTTMFATAEELDEVRAQLTAIIDKFAERIDDPAARPPGCRPIRLFVSASVAPTEDDNPAS